jgi:hypothetical protein
MKFDKTINSFCKLHESQQNKRTVLKLKELYQPVIIGVRKFCSKLHNQFYSFSVS